MGSRTLRNPYRRLQRRLDALDRRLRVQQMQLDQLNRMVLMLDINKSASHKALYEATMNTLRSHAIHKVNAQRAEAALSAVNFSACGPPAMQPRHQLWRRAARAMNRPVPRWAGLVAVLALAALTVLA